MNRRAFLAAAAAAAAACAAPPRSRMGVAATCYLTSRAFPKDSIAFLEYCHSVGAGGAQISLSSTEPDYARKLRGRAEELGMYFEAMGGLPRADPAAFERSVKAAKEAGSLCIRCACLGGRRYETFDSAAAWKKFVVESHAAVERAIRICEREKLPLALENHKDWTAVEMAELCKRYSSEYFGACLDLGNNMALLDDPMEAIAAIAPYTISTHIKDMALGVYPGGFLLSEVALGEGVVDIPQAIAQIQAARPATRMTLEMITRDPLKVPVLTEKYWATFEARNARDLARMLARAQAATQQLPRTTGLDPASIWRYEEDNVKRCLWYSRQKLAI